MGLRDSGFRVLQSKGFRVWKDSGIGLGSRYEKVCLKVLGNVECNHPTYGVVSLNYFFLGGGRAGVGSL